MKLLFVLFLCFGSFLSVSAQTGTADTIYVDVPAEEEAIEYALKMEETDSANQASVSHILDTYGWPSGLSDAANKAIFLVIDHSDLKTMNKYIGLFRDAVEKGYLSMNDLVTMEDRMLMNSG